MSRVEVSPSIPSRQAERTPLSLKNGRHDLHVTQRNGHRESELVFETAPRIVYLGGFGMPNRVARRARDSFKLWRGDEETDEKKVFTVASDIPLIGQPQPDAQLIDFLIEGMEKGEEIIIIPHSMGAAKLAQVTETLKKRHRDVLERHAPHIAVAVLGGAGVFRSHKEGEEREREINAQRKEFKGRSRRLFDSFSPVKSGNPYHIVESYNIIPPDSAAPLKGLREAFPQASHYASIKNSIPFDPSINYRKRLPQNVQEKVQEIDEKSTAALEKGDMEIFAKLAKERGSTLAPFTRRAYVTDERKLTTEEPLEPWKLQQLLPILAITLLQTPTRFNLRSVAAIQQVLRGVGQQIDYLKEIGVDVWGAFSEYEVLHSFEEQQDRLQIPDEQMVFLEGHTHSSPLLQPDNLHPLLDRMEESLRQKKHIPRIRKSA